MINQKQTKVLLELRKNSRETLTQISRKTEIPISTIFDMIKNGISSFVTRYACVLDFEKIGFNCRAHIVLRLKKEDKEDLKNYILKHPNVNSVYKINNGYDYLVETVFKNLRGLEDFTESLDAKFKIREKKVYYIIEDISREQFMTDRVHAGMIGIEV